MDLQELRKKIDGIDSRIVELYEERMDVCRQVAEYKIETGKNVFDKVREEEKLARVRAMTHNDFNSKGITELFEQIMSMSRKLQYQLLNEKGRTGRLPFFPRRFSGSRGRLFPGGDGALFRGSDRQHARGQLPGRHGRAGGRERGFCGASD